MKTKLVEVNEANWRECVKLEVAEEEKHFVDRNVFAIAEWKFEPENSIKAIYSDSMLVGMLAYYYHDGSYGKFYWLYHLIIEPKHQGKGIGQYATLLAIDEMRSLGAKEIVTSHHRDNIRAKHIYEKLGFKDKGLDGDDPFLILPAD